MSVVAKPKTYEDAKAILYELIELECKRRHRLYVKLSVRPGDTAEQAEKKIELLIAKLHYYADDPVEWIRDFGWAPDPRGVFGGKGRLKNLAPPRMVPLMPSSAQAHYVQSIHDAVMFDGSLHVNCVKSRQVAASTLLLSLFDHWSRFMPGFAGIVSSHAEEEIDPGGKGHRQGSSLFGRLRMMIDAIAWCLPELAYNQHRDKKWKAEQVGKGNNALFTDSEDARMRIVRPRWKVYKRDVFPEAKGNYIRGAVPGERFAQGDIFTVALLDEYTLYSLKKTGSDKATRDAVIPCCDHIITQFTIPDGGGLDSDGKALCDLGDSNPTLINLDLDVSDVGAYMILARFKCRSCLRMSRFGRRDPGPGKDGIEKKCTECGHVQIVRRFSAASVP
ncbi:MAG TPA: hypothetical protein VFH61_04665, partial [Thermoleophilia bacterium]|nr:hypothetical protein [Thermoleophilia bacterium]